ncbi:MAG TPA: glycosyltransferase family 39 protein [Tepidisphaeraceae bacterium]|nr:glycosyltransferase family 39 protein [Tepidisphaeraceae bacterium]
MSAKLWAIIWIVLALALALRLYGLTINNLWWDEIMSLEMSVGRGVADLRVPENQVINPPDILSLNRAPPLTSVWAKASEDAHPPLYDVMLRLWRDVFGSSDAAIRMLSVVWSMGAVVGMYFVGRRAGGVWAGVWAMTLMALNPSQIVYAFEARDYAMVVLEAVIAAYALLRCDEVGRIWPAVLALAVSAMLLTHYLAVPVVVGMAAYASIGLRGGARRRILAAIGAGVLVFLACWGPWLGAVRQSREPFGFHDPNPEHHVLRTFARLAETPIVQLVGFRLESDWSLFLLPVYFVIFVVTTWRHKKLLLWWFWAGGCVLAITFVDLRTYGQNMGHPRYTLLAGPAMILLVVLTTRGKWTTRLLPAAVALVSLFALPNAYVNWKGAWRPAAENIDKLPSSVPLVITAAPLWQGRPAIAYYNIDRYLRYWHGPVVLATHLPTAQVQKFLEERKAFLLIYDQPDDVKWFTGFRSMMIGGFDGVGIETYMVSKQNVK